MEAQRIKPQYGTSSNRFSCFLWILNSRNLVIYFIHLLNVVFDFICDFYSFDTRFLEILKFNHWQFYCGTRPGQWLNAQICIRIWGEGKNFLNSLYEYSQLRKWLNYHLNWGISVNRETIRNENWEKHAKQTKFNMFLRTS